MNANKNSKVSEISSHADKQYHLAYLTANDRKWYMADFLHFRHMTRRDPGVSRICMYIAISKVRPFTLTDARAIDRLVRLITDCPWFEVRAVIWKGNIGRDFSSAQACLKTIAETAADQDYVMVRSRSGYGPLTDSWYRAYVDQYKKTPSAGLVGSTINFVSPTPLAQEITTHVQTYVYLSQWQHIKLLMDDYPGAQCNDRRKVIAEGEIGLSQRIMKHGLSLSCLHWPNHTFSELAPRDELLPQTDNKKTVTDVPIRYKYSSYLRQIRELPRQLIWLGQLVFSRALPRMQESSRSPRHLYLKEYD